MTDRAAAWAALATDAAGPHAPLAARVAEAERHTALVRELGGIYFDFAKLDVTAATLARLGDLAAAAGFDAARAALFGGAIVNPSEQRAATHPAERGVGRPADVAAAAAGQAKLRAVAETVRGDPAVRHVVHIGIGGSALGPALLLDALGHGGDGPAVTSSPTSTASRSNACWHSATRRRRGSSSCRRPSRRSRR